jgi:hypothetical protein
MERMDAENVPAEVKARRAAHQVEVKMPGGTEVLGIVLEGQEAADPLARSQIAGPLDVIELVAVEVTLIGASVDD